MKASNQLLREAGGGEWQGLMEGRFVERWLVHLRWSVGFT